MSYLSSLLVLVGITAVATVSPGPDFAATVHSSTHSRYQGIFVALGILSAQFIWIIGSIVGLNVLLLRVSWIIELLRILGACYLIFLGFKLMVSAHRELPFPSPSSLSVSRFSAWRTGFFTDIGNPKTLAFFSSIFMTLFPMKPPVWVDLSCVFIILLINSLWYSLVIFVFSFPPVIQMYRRAKRGIDYVTGGLFLCFGLFLAYE